MQEIELIVERLLTLGYTLEQIHDMTPVDALELIIIDNELKEVDGRDN